MFFLILHGLVFSISLPVTQPTASPDEFWQAFRSRESLAWRCTSTKVTSKFLDFGNRLRGNAEASEAFSESFEKALLQKSACVLSAVNQLTGTTLKDIVRENISSPTFQEADALDNIMLTVGRRYDRVWREWNRIPTDSFERLQQIDRFAWTGPLFIKDRRLESLRNLGVVLSEKDLSQQNPHSPNEVIHFKTLELQGLILYGLVRQNELSPIQVTISSQNWPVRRNLRVGSSLSQLRAVLGEPSEKAGDTVTYKGETEQIDFQIDGKYIKKIVFSYYAD